MSNTDPYGQQPSPYQSPYGNTAPQQPGYGTVPQQPAYGYAPAAYPQSTQTNTMAIVALVGSFFISIVGIICGHIALKQIKETGEQGRGLALAGLIIGYVYTAIVVVIAIIYVLFFVFLFAAIPASSY